MMLATMILRDFESCFHTFAAIARLQESKKAAKVNKSTYGLAEWLWPRGAGMSQRTKGPNLKKVNFNKRSTRYIIAGFTHLSNSYARSLALVEG